MFSFYLLYTITTTKFLNKVFSFYLLYTITTTKFLNKVFSFYLLYTITTTKFLNQMFSFHYTLPLACSLSSFTTACLQSSNFACKGTTRQFMMALKQTTIHFILDFKLSLCCSNDELSSWYFPSVWVLKPTFRNTISVQSSTGAVEDGTDTVFRSVGFYYSDAGEIPRRQFIKTLYVQNPFSSFRTV